MTPEEKAIARNIFKLKVHESNGQQYEDLFIKIMNYADSNFKPIRPHGSRGDRKNDGYNNVTNTYYQVFAPEDILKSHASASKKIIEDFSGLIAQWPDVHNFYFVINDKYKGPYPDAEIDIESLKKTHAALENSGILLAKDLENTLFKLDDDQIVSIVGFIPSPDTLFDVKFSILNEVVNYVLATEIDPEISSNLVVPDWDEKIRFNKISPQVKTFLDAGSMNSGQLEEFLDNNGDCATQQLRDHIFALYSRAIRVVPTNYDGEFTGDLIFWEIVKSGAPRQDQVCRDAIIIIMAKFFESCDIFKEPKEI